MRRLLTVIFSHLRRALPPVRPAIVGAMLYGLAIALSAIIAQATLRGGMDIRLTPLALVFVLGAAVAFPVAWYVERLIPLRRRGTRFAVAAVFLVAITATACAGIFALQYRQYYAQWHGDFGTIIWVYQLVFTLAAAAYQFAVMGMRLFLPFGLAVMLGAALWIASRQRAS